MSKERNCDNCGYVEKESKSPDAKMYCANCNSPYCSEWVSKDISCEEWIQYTDTTRYYATVPKLKGNVRGGKYS